ncbi:hypothetical protein [Nonomuraea sp. NPDC050202]|jgi:hypothetical protein|uniref:hypothetical protein n=2 Tax=unclassified Nonomuraea TaxID=2593643 RepID=UPI0034101A36
MRPWATKRSSAIAAIGILCITAFSTPAAAASAPTVTFAYCSAGTSVFYVFCEAWWEGGTDPATAVWSAGPNMMTMSTRISDPVARYTQGGGSCIPGSLFGAKVTITDAAGVVTERWVGGGRACRG